ncbi:hypothetical protein K5E_04730 [Enterococcus thailandicus]|uniref:hypothetical protein n=1 Tax=Enterococcus thailandicus TaxID=417368 RepID=UPI0022DF355B|nr:hypothetical protein [Enterococcus thailandicus]MDA3964881.1 hypothetical protein [Enterococcus thailandicus]GMC08335.1 hypothetical protein K5E_04730 [Enterococcus thailandicus]
MFSKNSLLTRRQIKEICIKFDCKKNEFVVRKFQDGFLVSVNNKEYRVKFSDGMFSKIVYLKEMKRVPRLGKVGTV